MLERWLWWLLRLTALLGLAALWIVLLEAPAIA